jgi:peroxiredoxin
MPRPLQSRGAADKVETIHPASPSPEGSMLHRHFAAILFLGGTFALSLPYCSVTGAEGEANPTAVPAPAPEPPKVAPPVLPGHSMHGEAFDEGPRQKAYLMGGTGDVHFLVTTKVPLAQQFFDQGVGQLHGFWYFEAERSFRQVAALDPDCAMAYWGMAMANTNNDKRAKSLIEKAVQKKASASPREAAWIDALAAAYAGQDNAERRRKNIRDLEALVQSDPNDVEAKAFLALQIWKNGSWMTEKARQLPIASHQAVDALLDQIFQAAPMHPAHHYRIHLWDEEKAARALVSASLGGQSSPSIAHMWHMPGHTYSKLNRYADAAWQQEASARVDHAHMMRDGVLPDQIHNYAHNNEWLIRDLAFIGRVHDAIDLAKNMTELPRHPKYNMPEKKEGSSRFGYSRLADVLLQYELGNEIVEFSKTSYFAPVANDADEKLKQLRMLGLARFAQGNVDELRKQIAALEAFLNEERAARAAAIDKAERKARKDKKPKADQKALAEAMEPHHTRIHNIEPAISEMKGYLALATGDKAQARERFEDIKDQKSIRRDQLARAFSLTGDHAQAETLARKAVEQGPGEVYPLAVLVDVLHRAGKKSEAYKHFNQLRSLASAADLDVPVFQRLAPLAAELKLPADWRLKMAPGDVGVRPDLATLGPFRWQPTPATSWSLATVDGSPLSLEDYRGKPVVLIFFLGSGCLHCVEQLQKFAPLTSDYAAAGISLAAISSEPLDSLRAAREKLSGKETISFPLLADPDLNVFKSYRAYDDFEKMPLHATYLIDETGLVRWHDISYEPFTNAKFLLDESKRLLGR